MQKEEELARLQEENSHLRQFLNSALVKRLEEKTKVMGMGVCLGAAFPHGESHAEPEAKYVEWEGSLAGLNVIDPSPSSCL